MKLKFYPFLAVSAVLAAVAIWPSLQRRDTQSATAAEPKKSINVRASYAQLPLSFEANAGQVDQHVNYLARGAGYAIFLTQNETVLSLQDRQHGNAVVRLHLNDTNAAAKIEPIDQLAGKSNYLIGNDPKLWRTDVPMFSKIRYHEIYPGVDVVYHGNQRQLEYDFVVAPGADPRGIKLDFEGVDKIDINSNGDLVLQLAAGEIKLCKPLVYQEVNGSRREVAGRYVQQGKLRAGFEVAKYDANKPLVIDPVFLYSTYLGGSGNEDGYGIAVDALGAAYITGHTSSLNFPTKNPYQAMLADDPTLIGNGDAFVTKLSPDGTQLIYSTYLGGSCTDIGYGIAVNAVGEAYVTGTTGSGINPQTGNPDCGPPQGLQNPFQPFPQVHAFQTYGGSTDAFVTKLNAAGSGIVYSTFLGGSGSEEARAIAVDALGNAYVTGNTISSNFPTTPGAYQTTNGCPPSTTCPSFSSEDAFVTKISYDPGTQTTSLAYSTYLGGGSDDWGRGIAVDGLGNAYVTGYTFSGAVDGCNNPDPFSQPPFPTTAGAYQTTMAPSQPNNSCMFCCQDQFGNPTGTPVTPNAQDAFVTELNSTGTALVYSTYFGGGTLPPNINDGGFDEGHAIALDSAGNVYITGIAGSATSMPPQPSDFPTKNGFQTTWNGGTAPPGDGFIAKFQFNGTGTNDLIYSSYLGNNGSYTTGNGIVVDAFNNAYVGGTGPGTPIPPPNASPTPPCGICPPIQGYGAFYAKIDSVPTLQGMFVILSTRDGYGVALDPLADVYLTGTTLSGLSTVSAAQPNFGGGGSDAFVVKIGPDIIPTPTPTPTATPTPTPNPCDNVVCTPSDQCHDAGTCDPQTGVCSNPPKPNGTTCNDQNPGTSNDVCTAGTCQGTPIPCPPGYYSPDGTEANGACQPCAAGSYAPSSGSTMCISCAPGSYANTTGSVMCTSCSPGTYQPNAGASACSDCAPGQFNNMSGQVACTPCQPGNISTVPGSTSCTECPPGTSAPGGGTTCNPCPQGQYDPNYGSAVCFVCAPGTYNDQTGQTSCFACPPNTYATSPGSSACTACGCTAQDQCHVAGTCGPVTSTCSNPAKADGSSCNDGNACTAGDSCQSGVCTSGTPVVCTPSDQCHSASCDPSTGSCVQTALTGNACNDGNACTTNDTCQSGTCTGTPVAGCCNTNADCNDNNACTTDTCSGPGGTCSHTSITGCCNTNADCNDGNACTTDTCSGPGGTCSHTPIAGCCNTDAECSDGNACTTDTCNNHACSHSPIAGCCNTNADCNDNNACTTDTCSGPGGTCSHTAIAGCCNTNADCNDGNACTTDTCSGPGGTCSHSPIAGCCNTNADCNDGNACTSDTCNPSTHTCSHTPLTGNACDDGNACTTNDVCNNGTCAGTPKTCTASDQCHNAGTCDPSTGACSNPAKANGTTCNDGNACTTNDVCTNGTCAGTPKTCTASDQCHNAGTCDPSTGVCSNPAKPNGTACNDGNVCTTNDVCTNGTCGGTPTSCFGQVGTAGYWMNHPEAWCMQTIKLGCIVYTQQQAIAFMQQSTSKDMTYAMATQLIAAKLNANCTGANSSCVTSAINDADTWLCQHPVGSNVSASSSDWKAITATYNTLTQYNEGKLCAPARK